MGVQQSVNSLHKVRVELSRIGISEDHSCMTSCS